MYNDHFDNMPEGEVDYILEIGESLEDVAQYFEN
jgi:hypothetical protein